MTAGSAHPAPGFHLALPMAWYNRPAIEVAQDLLGCTLVRSLRSSLLAGRIVETEAYVGEEDLACHASKGRTERNAVMFGAPGHAYVYFIYGMYDMLNVVCQPEGRPEAVLLRALEPVCGIEKMRRLRGVERNVEIANGPGKLCRALGVTRRENGVSLQSERLWIVRGSMRADEGIATSPRIGVDYAGAHALRPLRFYIADNPYVSRSPRRRKRTSRRRPRST